MHRRTFLGLAAVSTVGAATACADGTRPATSPTRRPTTGPTTGPTTEGTPVAEHTRTRHTYGEDPSQHGELYLPATTPRGVVVVVHGGFWRAQYDAEALGAPLAADLAARGWAAWNLEYRRVGDGPGGGGPGGGGGAPATFDDIAAGIDRLADLDLDLSRVVTLGHSAGGHLATWAAARGRFGWTERVRVTHVISQAGVLDLRAAAADDLGAGAVERFLGRTPTEEDARFDPAQQLPVDVPVWCVHARADANVPISQSVEYVERAGAAGGEAELVEVPGDHFSVIDTGSEAWARQLRILDRIG